MHFYTFPVIETIDDVLPAIKRHDEFRVIEKEDMLIVNYFVRKEDTFKIDPKNPLKGIIQRECRGLLFDKNGNIIGRRFHKFFNVNELEETQEKNIDLTESHVVLDKLDGSMVSPVLIDGEIVLTTKMGITEVSEKAQAFLETQPNIKDFCFETLNKGYNPIFEWLDKSFVHQIKHEENELVLTAIRSIRGGRYSGPAMSLSFASKYNMSIAKTLHFNGDIQNICRTIKNLEKTEGIVIRFYNGHMLKIKTDWYLERARLFDSIRFEKDVIALISSQRDDDVIGLLEDSVREKYETYRSIVLERVETWAEKIESQLLLFWKERNPKDRREFHSIVSSEIDKSILPYYLKFMGDVMEGKKIKTKLFEYMLDRLTFYSSTSTRLEKHVKWMYEEDWTKYL